MKSFAGWLIAQTLLSVALIWELVTHYPGPHLPVWALPLGAVAFINAMFALFGAAYVIGEEVVLPLRFRWSRLERLQRKLSRVKAYESRVRKDFADAEPGSPTHQTFQAYLNEAVYAREVITIAIHAEEVKQLQKGLPR